MKSKDIKGNKYNMLTAVKKSHIGDWGHYYWVFRCECGNEKIINKTKVERGRVKSCGCLNKKTKNVKHGLSYSRLYNIWKGIKERCFYEGSESYKNYGGRGIKVCSEWLEDSENFFRWAIENGYNDALTIDRIDNNIDYSPENCRWITAKEQARNRRTNIMFTIRGNTKCLSEWCEIYNASYSKVWQRINRGWDIKEALLTYAQATKIITDKGL